MKTLTFHRWNSSFHVSSRGEEKHFSCVDPVETILTLFTGSCIDLMSNQCLYRLDHHCICIFFLMPYSIIGTHLVTFHCSNVDKPHLKITSKMNKQYTVFWPLTLRQISSFIGWKLFFLTGETFLFMCQAERKKYVSNRVKIFFSWLNALFSSVKWKKFYFHVLSREKHFFSCVEMSENIPFTWLKPLFSCLWKFSGVEHTSFFMSWAEWKPFFHKRKFS